MRILHVMPSLDHKHGGPIRSILDLSAQALRAGLDSEIVGFGEINLPDNPLPMDHIHSLPLAFPRRYAYAPALRPWLMSNLDRYDGVVIHGLWLYPNWTAHQVCKEKGKPYACFPHGMLDPWSISRQGTWKRLKKLVYWSLRERRILDGARAILFTTRREMVLAYDVYPRLQKTCSTIPYVVEVGTDPISVPWTKTYLQPADRKIALFLGRVHPKKNVRFLIEAWSRASLPPEWHLLIVGPAEKAYLRGLQKDVSRSGVNSNVHFLGAVSGDDKRYLLQRAQWFLLPSSQENFAIAALEAIYSGCPTVLSNQVYIGDSFHDESEILPLELDAWVKFMRERMVDDDWRKHIVERDKAEVLPLFDFGDSATAWIKMLRALFS